MYYITEVVGISISGYRNVARLLKMYIKFLGNTKLFVRNVYTTM